MRKVFLILLCVLTSGTSFSSASGPNLIDKSHFAFIHIRSGLQIDYDSDIKKISDVLGKPTIRFDRPMPNRASYKKYTWDGIELSVLPDNDIIICIRVTNRDFKTKDGVVIGEKMNGLTRIYGPPAHQRKNYLEFNYSDVSETWGLGFTSNDSGVISEIEIGRAD
jgi:hypothetical protein